MKCKWKLSTDGDYDFQSDCGRYIDYDSVSELKKFKFCPFCGNEFEFSEVDVCVGELQDGNLVLCNGAIYEVGNNLDLSSIDIVDELEPLFITSQIFKKIGLDSIGNVELKYGSFDKNGYIRLYTVVDGCVRSICKIYTVHELQNLYKILTGYKLDIRL